MDVRLYLERIGADRDGRTDLGRLTHLQRRHLLSIPFENLDVVREEEIVLEHPALFRKVVERERGGFCYELNGLFQRLLAEVGFDADLVSARVVREDGNLGPEDDHAAVLVVLDRPYLVDVGFGDFARHPLPLDGSPRTDASGTYRVRPAEGADARGDDGDGERVSAMYEAQCRMDDVWETEYAFTTEPRTLASFADACRYHQTSPDSPFTVRAVCTLATDAGRVTYVDDSLTVTEGGEVRKTPVSPKNRDRVLVERFGVRL